MKFPGPLNRRRGGANAAGSRVYAIFVWHGFFLALTKAALDLNTVFPALTSTLVDSKAVFGLLYSIMLGVPFVFNIFFGHYLHGRSRKKPYLILGIYLRAAAFLGMAAFTLFFAASSPFLVLASLFGWIFLFSISGGLAGLAYADLIGTLTSRGARGTLYASKQLAASIAMLLGGALFGGLLSLEALPYPENYALILCLGGVGLLIAAFAFWFIPEEARLPHEQARESFSRFLRDVPAIVRGHPDFLRFILVGNLSSFSLMILPFYMLFAVDSLGIGQEWVGRFLLVQVLGAVFSNFLWGYLSRRRDSRSVVRGCILLGAIIPLVALLLRPFGPGAFLVVFLMVGFVMSGRSVGFEPYLLDLAPEDQRTLFVGINGTLNFSMVLLPAIGGILVDVLGYPVTFLAVVLFMALAFALLRKPVELPETDEQGGSPGPPG